MRRFRRRQRAGASGCYCRSPRGPHLRRRSPCQRHFNQTLVSELLVVFLYITTLGGLFVLASIRSYSHRFGECARVDQTEASVTVDDRRSLLSAKERARQSGLRPTSLCGATGPNERASPAEAIWPVRNRLFPPPDLPRRYRRTEKGCPNQHLTHQAKAEIPSMQTIFSGRKKFIAQFVAGALLCGLATGAASADQPVYELSLEVEVETAHDFEPHILSHAHSVARQNYWSHFKVSHLNVAELPTRNTAIFSIYCANVICYRYIPSGRDAVQVPNASARFKIVGLIEPSSADDVRSFRVDESAASYEMRQIRRAYDGAGGLNARAHFNALPAEF